MKTIKVKITRSSRPNFWYNKKIGETFTVRADERHYIFAEPTYIVEQNGYASKAYFINVLDAEVINENPFEARVTELEGQLRGLKADLRGTTNPTANVKINLEVIDISARLDELKRIKKRFLLAI